MWAEAFKMGNSTGHNSQNGTEAPGIPATDTPRTDNKNMDLDIGTAAPASHQHNSANGPNPESTAGQITDKSDAAMDVDGPGDGFMEVNKKKGAKTVDPLSVIAKKHQFGVQIARTCTGDSRISNEDLSNLFQLIANIDSNALILPANKIASNAKKATSLSKSQRMDYITYLDIQTTAWGRPSDQKKRTTLSFWIASDEIHGVKALRDNHLFKAFLMSGKCSMSETHLTESRSKIIAYFEGKDPKHTHRLTLQSRVTNHISLQLHNQGISQSMPVNVVSALENGIAILAIAAGSKDAINLEHMLTDHPIPGLGLIFHSWKRKQKDEFAARIQGHQMLVMNSKAYKITSIDPALHDQIAADLHQGPAKDYIVDVCQTGHSQTTGVLYVQYLQGHEAAVLAAIKECMERHPNPDSTEFGPAYIANEGKPDAPTLQSQRSNGNKSDAPSLPQSRWQNQIQQWSTKPQTSTNAIPAAITTAPKSFSAALMANLTRTDSSEDSTLTPRTGNTGSRTSKRSAQVEALERENATLREQLEHMRDDMEELIAKAVQEQMSRMLEMMQIQQREQWEEWKQTHNETPREESPVRKRPDSKKTPSKTDSQISNRRLSHRQLPTQRNLANTFVGMGNKHDSSQAQGPTT